MFSLKINNNGWTKFRTVAINGFLFYFVYQIAVSSILFSDMRNTIISVAILFSLGLSYLVVLYQEEKKFNYNYKSVFFGRSIEYNFLKSLMTIFYIVLIIIGILLLTSLAVQMLNYFFEFKSLNTVNQQQIDDLASGSIKAILSVIIFSNFLAPIIEEHIFRFIFIGPKHVKITNDENTESFKNKHRLIRSISSGILFTLGHLIDQLISTDYSNFDSYMNLIEAILQYGIPAAVLTIIYYKKGNIRFNLLLHISYNLFVNFIL